MLTYYETEIPDWKYVTNENLIKEIIRYYDTNIFHTSNYLKILIIRLLYYNLNISNLIGSEDTETSDLGIQLLFKDILYLYNTLNCSNVYH